MSTPLFVGLDVGGSAMKAGVVDDAGKPLASVSLPTEAHRGQEFGLERMCETIRQAVVAAGLTMSDIAAIGVASRWPRSVCRPKRTGARSLAWNVCAKPFGRRS